MPKRRLVLDTPTVMGILNVTPDSFSDGGRYLDADTAVLHALAMLKAGATIIDVGGESSRPGSLPVSESEEVDRVAIVIERLRALSDCAISIDTTKPKVMRVAMQAGADIINDINALQSDGALAVAVESQSAVVLMHMQGLPQHMQTRPSYQDVVTEVFHYLEDRMHACLDAGLSAEQICLDPGIGFGKSLDHNLALLANLGAFSKLGRPLLIGVSRKAMFKQLLGVEMADRLIPSVVAAALAVHSGAAIVRAHDIHETVQSLALAHALLGARNP